MIKIEENFQFGIMEVPEENDVENLEIKKLIEAIHRDFDETVLKTEVIPNPPERYSLGYGKIELKPGSIPKKIQKNSFDR